MSIKKKLRYIVTCSEEEEMKMAVKREEAEEERFKKWVWNEIFHGFFLEKIPLELNPAN